MVIYIDKTVGQYFSERQFNEDEEVFFSQLACSAYYGKCFLCGELASLELLSSYFSGQIGAIFARIKNSYAGSRSVIESVNRALLIVCTDEYRIPPFFPESTFVTKVEDAIQLSFADSKCALIGENIDDCRFYTLIGRRYMFNQSIRGVDIVFENVHGAGNTIKDVLNYKVSVDHKLSLCLVDSDMKYGPTEKFPQIASGNTWRGVDDVANRLSTMESSFFQAFRIDAHEIENLIPLSVFDLIQSQIPEIAEGLYMLRLLQSVDQGEPILYYDIKEGISNTVLSNLEKPKGLYWNFILEKLHQNGYSEQRSFPRLSSNNILKRANCILEGNYSSVLIDDHLTELWSRIGKTIYTWGCSNLPMRT